MSKKPASCYLLPRHKITLYEIAKIFSTTNSDLSSSSHGTSFDPFFTKTTTSWSTRKSLNLSRGIGMTTFRKRRSFNIPLSDRSIVHFGIEAFIASSPSRSKIFEDAGTLSNGGRASDSSSSSVGIRKSKLNSDARSKLLLSSGTASRVVSSLFHT